MKPGETRNPNGRPKKEWSLTGAMRDFLSEKDPETKKVRRDQFIETQYKYALKGDPTASKHLWNYIDGMPKQKTELTGADGEDLFKKITFKLDQSVTSNHAEEDSGE
jgi:hypothetical protein